MILLWLPCGRKSKIHQQQQQHNSRRHQNCVPSNKSICWCLNSIAMLWLNMHLYTWIYINIYNIYIFIYCAIYIFMSVYININICMEQLVGTFIATLWYHLLRTAMVWQRLRTSSYFHSIVYMYVCLSMMSYRIAVVVILSIRAVISSSVR